MSEYKLPPHRRGIWFSMFWWFEKYRMEEIGFVIKNHKKISARYRLCGSCYLRWWKLVEVSKK
mgnify:CR=1 FL=1